MALADRKSNLAHMESFEARRLLAFVASGTAGVVATGNVLGAESAAARPDANHTHFAVFSSGSGGGNTLQVSQVTGTDSSAGGTDVTITTANGATIENADIAANNLSANTFVVTWQSTTTNPQTGVITSVIDAQLFSNGTAVGSVINVSGNAAGTIASDCRVAMANDGSFVVVWQGAVGSGTQVFARRFGASGSGQGGAVQISGNNGSGSGSAVEPDVAANANGQYVIAWVDGNNTLAETFNNRGGSTSDVITVVNQTFTEPAVGMFSNGGFVIAYGGSGAGANTAIFAQRFNSDGNTVGGLTQVSTTTGAATIPEVSVATNNSYAIGWTQADSATPTNFDSIAFNAYTSGGTAIGPETTISGVTFSNTDRRFGLAYRVPGVLYVDYAQGGDGLEQAYTDSTNGGGGGSGGGPGSGDEIAVPSGALLIDQTTNTVGEVIDVQKSGSNTIVTIDGVAHTYTTASYTSIYIRAGTGSDLITVHSGVTLPATIYGRAGNDIIYGGSGNDLIDGEDGWDQIQGYDGNDTILGGAGRNTLFGGAGTDSLVGGGGTGTDLGGFAGGNSAPRGTAARKIDTVDRQNVMYGEDGNDSIFGSDADDIITGGAGADSIVGNGGVDSVHGGLGNDTIEGDDGDDFLYGDRGNDFIVGNDGNDFLSGGRDNDSLYGNDGNDTLYGDANVDRLVGGGAGRSVLGSTPGDVGYVDGADENPISIEFIIGVR